MKILITGGKGYIGSALTKALSEEHDVISIGRKDLDLTNSESVNQFFDENYFDVILHCANEIKNPLSEDWSGLDDNLIMYYNLFFNRNRFGKFINFGSGAELDEELNKLPYGFSKSIIAKSVWNYHNFYNIRLWGLFDENENNTRFIKANILRYINKEPMMIKDKKMSFFYMEDLITLINYIILTPSSKLLKEHNCAYVDSTLLLDIANIINDLDDYKVPIYMDIKNETDYESKLNVPYSLNYKGLYQGIINVYEKLKFQKILNTSKHANEY